jgi:hypothetical protein
MSKLKLPTYWQIDNNVQVIFPGNGKLQGKIVKVSFPKYGETLYDIEIPFDRNESDEEPDSEDQPAIKKGFFRIHGVNQWFLSHTQEDWDKMRANEEKEAQEG